MSGEDSEQRLEELFQLASDLPAAAQDAFIERHCGEDAELAERLRALLVRDAQETSPLLRGGMWEPTSSDEEHIGPYRLIKLLGEGGMGSVHLAEQEEPIRRKVAIKRIRLGLHTEDVAARFESERAALALMDHPGIARIYDAGVTDSGLPYFVMEYVQGLPITEYCKSLDLTLEERLELFTELCRAVQHAHQKGIVHRDLKPSNVLVAERDGRPTPKVIDFGIARAISGQLADAAKDVTQDRPIGTLAYMSPEQADPRLGGVDTRTDVYALGVILYELLTDDLPFGEERLHKSQLLEAIRVVAEEIPPPPSKRAQTPHLARRLRGDLDWIVGRALEKERSRRYPAASELANDVQRHLASEPVNAGPPSATYRLGRLARRNPVKVALSVLLVVSLVAGVLGTTRAMLRAEAAEERLAQELSVAVLQRKNASAIAEFMTQSLNRVGAGEELTVTELLDRGQPMAGILFKMQPAEEAAVRTALGRAYLAQGADTRALAEYQQALALLETLEDTDELDLFQALDGIAQAMGRAGELERAVPYSRRAFDLALKRLGADDPDIQLALEAVRDRTADSGSVEPLLTLLQSYPDVDDRTEDTLLLGRTLMEIAGQLVGEDSEEADEFLRALDVKARDLIEPDEDVRFQSYLWFLASACLVPGRENLARARSYAEELRQGTRDLLPVGHWMRIDANRLLGLARGLGGDYAAAEGLLLEARDEARTVGMQSSRLVAAANGLDELAERLAERDVEELRTLLAGSWSRWQAGPRTEPWWPVVAPTAPETLELALAVLPEDAHLFRAAALLGLDRADEARVELTAVPEEPLSGSELGDLRAELARELGV